MMIGPSVGYYALASTTIKAFMPRCGGVWYYAEPWKSNVSTGKTVVLVHLVKLLGWV